MKESPFPGTRRERQQGFATALGCFEECPAPSAVEAQLLDETGTPRTGTADAMDEARGAQEELLPARDAPRGSPPITPSPFCMTGGSAPWRACGKSVPMRMVLRNIGPLDSHEKRSALRRKFWDVPHNCACYPKFCLLGFTKSPDKGSQRERPACTRPVASSFEHAGTHSIVGATPRIVWRGGHDESGMDTTMPESPGLATGRAPFVSATFCRRNGSPHEDGLRRPVHLA